jgi:tetratricopeptide (TPR) repeat protein
MKIYISSTRADLKNYRDAVSSVIRGLGHQAIAMEDYHAEDQTPAEKVRNDVAECDVYLGMVAWRYGFMPESCDCSITELEYRTAVEHHIPTLIFLLDDEALWPPRFIDDGEQKKRLLAFREELKHNRLVSFFESPDDLSAKAAQALAKLAARLTPRDPRETETKVARSRRETRPRIYLSRLPITGAARFGRDEQLKQMDEAWDTGRTNVLSIVAWGGVGKSALINTWLARLANGNYRGAERAFGWSFYDQESQNQESSADVFIAEALAWFGDEDPTLGLLWEKGQRLAELVRQQRTLLVLDGLEVLQQPPGPDEGRLKDQAVQALLRNLAWQNPGLCVIATRLPLFDLQPFVKNTVEEINLEQLTPEAGAELLQSLGVKGAPAELIRTSREFGGHALALTLLAGYLAEWHDGQIWKRDEINQEEGDQWRRMIASYERMLGPGPELAVLRILGLFNGPAHGDALSALRELPEIPGLTGGLSNTNWNRAVSKLRKLHLVASRNPDRPHVLDAHPMVRQHFGQQLQAQSPAAWRDANNRLFEHYQKLPVAELPVTLDEMVYLFQAVTHGCRAGRRQEAWDKVYWPRIRRKDEGFSVVILGAYGADLVALANFFEVCWDRPAAELDNLAKARAQTSAAFNLRGLGRLEEAVSSGRAGLNTHLSLNGWIPAGDAAGNLSESLVTFGDLRQAIVDAQLSIELAAKGGDQDLLVTNRATLADALHQSGKFEEAWAHFKEAEGLLNKIDPSIQYLHALRGYHFCDLLLDMKQYPEVLERATASLEVDRKKHLPHGVGLAYLAMARTHMLQRQDAPPEELTTALELMRKATRELKVAGHQDLIVRGLLASAELSLAVRSYDQAKATLDDAYASAIRGQMRLHEADAYLIYARLYLAGNQRALAQKSFTEARRRINAMGYHRRDAQLRQMEEELQPDDLRP